MTPIEYFGTDLRTHGHYLWKLKGDSMQPNGEYLGNLPFNPEDYPKWEKGAVYSKGDAQFIQVNGCSIIAIEGSCVDNRWGSKSVFFVRQLINKEQLINMIQTTFSANAIITQMPFEINWTNLQLI